MFDGKRWEGMGMKVMGIINVTPDSFYEDSRVKIDELLERVNQMIKEGAEIIDVGGESTRPGSDPVPLEEELNRVIPAIKLIKENFNIKVSVDTYKAKVAQKALEAGADIVNDISAMMFDPDMVKVVADNKVPVILMHIKGTPKDMQQNPTYEDVVKEIKEYFIERINFAKAQGIEQVILDPGIGFGKKLEHNLEILRRIKEFKELGYPILIGASRKSMIGMILNGLPPSERLEGTLAITAYCALNGVDYIRVHDVKENFRVVKVIEAIMGVDEK